ncbi:PTS system, mannitol-specific IIA component [Spiroplasma corruscae]|uniref:PTS system, mannitol-specific IIA component n=1 Tax=Spiroplasma corruscae TaxID=216934 RepID=A0A222EPN5_9MOLU|nr:PTS sugar transporter subunit IIA [Spiroplasma corruscae]ASP28490.1 PTS system, mannitol-specific IIA component [Spiroplasma corruscae]
MKKERQLRLLQTLINYKNIDKNVLINQFSMSNKTLQRDIIDINNFLKLKGKFYITEDEKEICFNGLTEDILNKLQIDDTFLLKEERLLYIYLILVKDTATTKLQLMDDLDVSINVLEDDIKDLSLILKTYSQSLSLTKQGIKLSKISKEIEISIAVDITIKYLLFKKVYSILKLNKIEKLFSNYIYKSLKSRYKINVYNKIFYWLIEFTSNQINISVLNVIILAIKITYWLNHPNNNEILKKIDSIEYYNEFVLLIKNIYSNNTLDLNYINQLIPNKEKETISLFIKDIKKDVSNLFNNNLKLSDDIVERIRNHITSNLFIENIDDYIIVEYKRNLDNYKTTYNELWNVIEINILKYFNNKKNKNLLKYEVFIHILVWFDSYLYNNNLSILTICIGGMGQSAMIKNHLNSLYRNAVIENISYAMVDKDKLSSYDLVISSIDLSEQNIKNILIMPIIMLLSKKNDVHKIISEKIYKKLIGEKMGNQILKKENIKINQSAKNKVEAIKQCGELLKELGYIEESYIESMIEREKKFSVYIGNYLAIPHGMNETGVIKDGIVVIHYNEPIDYDGSPVNFFIGIAAKSNNHVDILANIAEKMMELDFVEELIAKPSKDRILEEFNF